VQVIQTTDANTRTIINAPTPLTGTLANSTTTVPVPLPTSGMSVLIATATLDAMVAFNRPIHFNGERVNKVEIAASFGGASEVTYITESGRRIKLSE